TCVLFGDGAGAVVLAGREGESGVLATVTHASGAQSDLLYARVGPRGSYDQPAAAEVCLQMKGPELFRWAVRCMEEVAREVLERAGIRAGEVDLLIPHQANLRIIKSVAERLDFPLDKVFVNLETYGNTSAASVPIALDEAVRAGRLTAGDLVLLVACGGGLTWAASLIRW
ncbi:MAG: 3-oxoacyl-[acyl-carrier-protein] synthase III C-terminal domain-containing protein, partial [Candidatus Binatia bacterium]